MWLAGWRGSEERTRVSASCSKDMLAFSSGACSTRYCRGSASWTMDIVGGLCLGANFVVGLRFGLNFVL